MVGKVRRVPRRPAVPTAALAAALAVAGCGGGGGQSDDLERFEGAERQVADVVVDLRDTARRGDSERLCSTVLSQELVTRFEQAGGEGCAAAVEEAIRDADSFDLTVQEVEVQGDQATARVRSQAGEREQTDVIRLVRERGRWRVSALQAQA
jgi:copper chaperone CopZ